MKKEVVSLISSLTEASNYIEIKILRAKIMNRTLSLMLKDGDKIDDQTEKLRIILAVKEYSVNPSQENAETLQKLRNEIDRKFRD